MKCHVCDGLGHRVVPRELNAFGGGVFTRTECATCSGTGHIGCCDGGQCQ
jgi:hypothetical protein